VFCRLTNVKQSQIVIPRSHLTERNGDEGRKVEVLDFETWTKELKAYAPGGFVKKRTFTQAAMAVWEANGFSLKKFLSSASSATPAGSRTTRRRPSKKPAKNNIHVSTGEIRRVSKNEAENAKKIFDGPKLSWSTQHLSRLQRAMYFEHQAIPTAEFLL
jgi:hypothetical protein